MDSSDLAARLAREKAFVTFFDAHVRRFHNYARTRGNCNSDDAMEVTMDACMAAWHDGWFTGPEDTDRCRSQIMGRITDRMKDKAKAECTRERLHPEVIARLSSYGVLPQPDEEFAVKELHAYLHLAAGTMSQRRQDIFRYRVIDGLSAAETAALLGISVSNVESTKSDVLRILRTAAHEWLPNTPKRPKKKPDPPKPDPSSPLEPPDNV